MLNFVQYFVVLGCTFWLFTSAVADVIDYFAEKLK